MQRPEQRDEVEMLALMLLIRRFEERASQQYQAQKIGGFCHLYIGQEAVVAGAVAAVRDDDYIITAYRDHGHALARGTSANACMADTRSLGRMCRSRPEWLSLPNIAKKIALHFAFLAMARSIRARSTKR